MTHFERTPLAEAYSISYIYQLITRQWATQIGANAAHSTLAVCVAAVAALCGSAEP